MNIQNCKDFCIFNLYHWWRVMVIKLHYGVTWQQCGAVGSPCIIYLWREQSVQQSLWNTLLHSPCFPLLSGPTEISPTLSLGSQAVVQQSKWSCSLLTADYSVYRDWAVLCPSSSTAATKQYLGPPSSSPPSHLLHGYHAYHYVTDLPHYLHQVTH